MRIEIQSTDLFTKSGNAKTTGKPYSIRKQDAWAHIEGQPYPVRISFNLEDNAAPYQIGMYVLDERSFYVDKFGNLSIGRLLLNPIQK